MKKTIIIMILSLTVLLAGCGAEETFETIGDFWEPLSAAPQRRISVDLPGEAATESFPCDSGRMYFCDEYEIYIDTMQSGDLEKTIHSVSGYEKDDLTIVKTKDNDIDRYEFAWSAAGENGDRIGRSVILDDGQYHYVISVLRDAEPAASSQIIWNDVFRSFEIV